MIWYVPKSEKSLDAEKTEKLVKIEKRLCIAEEDNH